MVGATVHAGTSLHSVNGHCQEAEAVGLSTPGFVAFAPQAGGAAGAAKAMDCPPGYAVTGMNGTLSDVACSIQLTCTRIEML